MNAKKWDDRFFTMAKQVSAWSKDPKRKVGAVVVASDMRQLSVGYNGFPRGVRDDEERLADEDLKNMFSVHAELNAMSQAGFPLDGATLYVTQFPCHECMKSVVQHGVKRVVAAPPRMDEGSKWEGSWGVAQQMAKEAGVDVLCVWGGFEPDDRVKGMTHDLEPTPMYRGARTLKLIMAVSSDGYLARGPDDDMRWTGKLDKTLFHLMTSVGGVCGTGSKTWSFMPTLPGRLLLRLTRSGTSVREFSERYPGAWLLGGPTVARGALEMDLVAEAHLFRSTHALKPAVKSDALHMDMLSPWIPGSLPLVTSTSFQDGVQRVLVQTYRHQESA